MILEQKLGVKIIFQKKLCTLSDIKKVIRHRGEFKKLRNLGK
jgi:hypothetical protein